MIARLFVHSPSEVPDARVMVARIPELESLGERALLLARPGDVVCVARPVDEAYLDFLDSLELGPSRADIVVVDGVRPGTGLSARLVRDRRSLDRVARRLRGAGPVVVSPFFSTADAFALGRVLQRRLSRSVDVEGGSPELARKLHDKVTARALARSLGIPVAPGEVVRMDRRGGVGGPDLARLRAALERWVGVTGHVIARGAFGASGSSIFTTRSADIDSMVEAIAERTDNARYLVEPLFDAQFSPNVEVRVDPDVPPPGRAAASEQLLDRNLVYAGSLHPCRALRLPRMIGDALAIAGWMRQRGFRGRVGCDFVEYAGSEGEPAHFLTEINPRVNGASYPLALLRRLIGLAERRRAPAPAAFRTGTVRVESSGFPALAEHSRAVLYDPARGAGIVPYSVGAIPHGSVGAACFGTTREVVEELRREFLRSAGVPPDGAASADAA